MRPSCFCFVHFVSGTSYHHPPYSLFSFDTSESISHCRLEPIIAIIIGPSSETRADEKDKQLQAPATIVTTKPTTTSPTSEGSLTRQLGQTGARHQKAEYFGRAARIAGECLSADAAEDRTIEVAIGLVSTTTNC